MGVVHRAKQLSLARDVALKVISERVLGSSKHEEVIARFEREVRSLIAVSHPNIVRVYDVGTENGLPWVAMELVDGQPLSALMRERRPMEVSRALKLVRQLADALAACHARGLIHRDVKPGNVMLGDGDHITLMDFGLVKDTGAAALTRAEAFIGTPHYAPPEMFDEGATSAAGDVYALGVMLHEMLAGAPAFSGKRGEELYLQVAAGPAPIGTKRPGLPAELVAILERMLSRNTAERPTAPEVVAFVDAWQAAQVVEPVEAPAPPSGISRVSRKTGRVPLQSSSVTSRSAVLSEGQGWGRRAGVAAVVAGVVVVLAVVAMRDRGDQPAPVVSVSAVAASVPASAAPSPAAAPRVTYPALFGRWREFTGEKAALAGGGDAARAAAGRMRKAVGLELPGGSEPWAHWIELGQWLAGDGPRNRPPRYAKASREPMDRLSFRGVQAHLRDRARTFGPQLVGLALREVGRWPNDGRAWTLLGHALELEGAAPEAGEAYRWAVDHLPALASRGSGAEAPLLQQATLADAAPLHWYTLVRAVLSQPRVELAHAFWAHDPALDNLAWSGIGRALRDRSDLHDALVAAAPAGKARGGSNMSDIVALRRGHWLVEHGDAEGGLAVWKDSHRAGGGWETYMTVLLYLLERGRVAEARAFTGRPAAGEEPEAVLRTFEATSGTTVTAEERTRMLTIRRVRTMEIVRLLEAGAAGEAEAIARGTADLVGGVGDASAAAYALAGHAAPGQEWARVVHDQHADAPYDDERWIEAAGDLATPAGAPHFERAVTACAGRWSASPIPLLARAVWASRQDRHAEALDLLAQARARGASGLIPAHAVLEVLARPVLMRGIGRKVDEAIAARALADPGTVGDPVAAPIWLALRAWKLGEARDLARRAQEASPFTHAWTLVALACARLDGPRARFEQWRNEALEAARMSTGPAWRRRLVRAIGAGS
jgi:hypothetical protein